MCFTGPGSRNLAPLARATTLLARHVTAVAHAFRHGWAACRSQQFRQRSSTAVMDGIFTRGLLDGRTADGQIVPLVDGLADRLGPAARGSQTSAAAPAMP